MRRAINGAYGCGVAECDNCYETVSGSESTHALYECGICECLHAWDFDGDCRQDNARYGNVSEYAAKFGVDEFDVEVRSWEEHVMAD